MATDTERLLYPRGFRGGVQARMLPPWWLLPITGIASMLTSPIILRFD